jgi:hypothetical protein
MAELREIIGYFCKFYPNKELLSKARLTKLVYLADWKSCLNRGHQISNIKWMFNHFGPYVADIETLALEDQYFNVSKTFNLYGEKKDLISLKKEFPLHSIKEEDQEISNNIIRLTCNLNWEKFIQLVYSTYPVIVSTKMDFLDLKKLAAEYNKN